MLKAKKNPGLTRRGRQQAPRGDETRDRILTAAIETFGLYGFAGASTRMLAQAAKVNIQAIHYYFGGKEGLYLASADHIGEHLRSFLGPTAQRIRERLQALAAPGAPALPAEDARALLIELLSVAATAVVQEASGSWARFMMREQMEPTEAFERIYANVMRPIVEAARQLVGILLQDDPRSEHVGVRTLATLGQVVFFRVARAAVMRQLGWTEVGSRELESINRMTRETIAAIAPSRNEGSRP